MNQLRQSIASKDATKSSEDYQDANTDLQMHTTVQYQMLKVLLVQRITLK